MKSIGHLVLDFVLGAAVIMIVDYLFAGVYVKNFQVAFLVAMILAFLKAFVKPLLSFLALPFTILSFGLFQLVINGFVLSLVQKVLYPDFYIESFGLTVMVSIIISFLYSIFGIGGLHD